MNTKYSSINPAFEEELKKTLDKVWANRCNLDYNSLKMLSHLINKNPHKVNGK